MNDKVVPECFGNLEKIANIALRYCSDECPMACDCTYATLLRWSGK